MADVGIFAVVGGMKQAYPRAVSPQGCKGWFFVHFRLFLLAVWPRLFNRIPMLPIIAALFVMLLGVIVCPNK